MSFSSGYPGAVQVRLPLPPKTLCREDLRSPALGAQSQRIRQSGKFIL